MLRTALIAALLALTASGCIADKLNDQGLRPSRDFRMMPADRARSTRAAAIQMVPKPAPALGNKGSGVGVGQGVAVFWIAATGAEFSLADEDFGVLVGGRGVLDGVGVSGGIGVLVLVGSSTTIGVEVGVSGGGIPGSPEGVVGVIVGALVGVLVGVLGGS